MVKRRRHSATFADLLANETVKPVVYAKHETAEPRGPLWRDLIIVADGITPERDQELARAGAVIGWDGCGSRDFEEALLWLSDSDVRRLAASKPPHVRHGGNLVECQLPDGRRGVVAELDVRWGSLL